MRKLLAIFFVLISCHVVAQDVPLPKEEEETIRVMTQVMQGLNTEKGSQVWPGYNIPNSPVILTFDSGHIYAFNMLVSDPVWQRLEFAGQTVFFSDKDLWEVSKVPLHPCFPIEGKEAYVFHIDQAQVGSVMPYLVFLHEGFHQHQFEHFAEPPIGEYRDHLNPRNLALIELEDKSLSRFLETRNVEFIKDFIAVNRERRQLLSEASLSWEAEQQLMEGLADYVGPRTFDLFSLSVDFNGRAHIREGFQHREDDSITDYAIKWRHYGVGATIAYALDLLQVPNWKEKVETGSTLQGLLDETIYLSKNELASRLRNTKLRCHYLNILRRISSELSRYEQRLKRLEWQYRSSPGVSVVLSSPPVGISGGGSSQDNYYRPDGSTLCIGDTSCSVSDDNLWNLNFDEMPFIFQLDSGKREFKVAGDVEVIADGKPYSLKEIAKKQVHFGSLKLRSSQCQLSSDKYSGIVSMRNGKLLISYTS